MQFQPFRGMVLSLGQTRFEFLPHPLFPEDQKAVFVLEGGTAWIYQVRDCTTGALYALKVFKQAFRNAYSARLQAALAQYPALSALRAQERLCIQGGDYPRLVQEFPDIEYAIVMPWVSAPTWAGILQNPQASASYTPEQARQLAWATASALRSLEVNGLAHADIAGSNIALASDWQSLQLLDLENMYIPGMPPPPKCCHGSPGYQHRQLGPHGHWCPEGDRFAGAMLLTEILTWWNPRVRGRVPDGAETVFQPEELQGPENPCWRVVRDTLYTISPQLLALFDQAWFSPTLADCPPLSAWADALLQELTAVPTVPLPEEREGASTDEWDPEATLLRPKAIAERLKKETRPAQPPGSPAASAWKTGGDSLLPAPPPSRGSAVLEARSPGNAVVGPAYPPSLRTPVASRSIVVSLLLVLLLVGGGVLFAMRQPGPTRATRSTSPAVQSAFSSATARSYQQTATATAGSSTSPPADLPVPSAWHQVLNDPLTLSAHDSLWASGGLCQFQATAYEERSKGLNVCAHGGYSIAPSVYGDHYYRLDLSIQKGRQAGLVFRKRFTDYYYFSITTTGQYSLSFHAGSSGGGERTLVAGNASMIHQGLNQWNTLAVLVRGTSFALAINGVQVNFVTDATRLRGILGVAVNGPGPPVMLGQALFKNAVVWVP